MRPLRIGTRGSALARWQAEAVAAALAADGVATELVTITTRGDRAQDVPLTAIGGKGVFVGEIHEALRRLEIDLAVHSAKDMAASSPGGLTVAAVLAREDPRDALILPAQLTLEDIGDKPLLGTGSPRRIAQLRRMFPAARFEPIRGNVDTRLRKLDAGDVDALVLACAGLRRLGLGHRITLPVPVADCMPAPGQGIIAIEIREGDVPVREAVERLNDAAAGAALQAEQAVVAGLGGGCQLPLGVYAEVDGGRLSIRALAAAADGSSVVAGRTTGDSSHPAAAGTRLARDLARRGARELLNT